MKLYDEALRIAASIATLAPNRQLPLYLLLIESMREGYSMFCEDTNRAPLAEKDLDDLWHSLSVPMAGPTLDVMYSRVDKECPDTEEFSSPYTSMALDFCVSILGVIRYIQKGPSDDLKHIVLDYAHYYQCIDDDVGDQSSARPNCTTTERSALAMLGILEHLAHKDGDDYEVCVELARDMLRR